MSNVSVESINDNDFEDSNDDCLLTEINNEEAETL